MISIRSLRSINVRCLNPVLLALVIVVSFGSAPPANAYHFPWDQGHDTTEEEDADDPGPCEGIECKNDPCGTNSDASPVYLATGTFVWSETDIELKGRPRMAVSRTFNSRDPRIGLVGSGWSMSCDEGLYIVKKYSISDTSIQADTDSAGVYTKYARRLPNGRRYIYSYQEDGTYKAPGLFDTVVPLDDNKAKLENRDGSYAIYDSYGKILSKSDRNGNLINYSYSADDKLILQADEHGRTLAFEYNSNGLLTIIRDHSGREWHYSYDANANLIAVKNPIGGERLYEYSQFQAIGDGHEYSHLTKVTDESGVIETEVFYSQAEVSSYKELENTFSYVYDRTNRRVLKTDSIGSQWLFTYSETGQVLQEIAPLGRTMAFERDDDSLLTKYIDPLGTEYSYTYDEFSNELSDSDDRGTITTTYDNEKPWPLTVTSRSGRVMTYEYDANGNLLSITDPTDAETEFAWSPQGDLLQVTNALGNQTSITYSQQGLPLTATDPLNRLAQYQYDGLNNLTQVINPAGEVMTYEYDALDRIVAVTDGNGDRTSMQYDPADRITMVTVPSGESVQYQYDGYGRMTKRIFYDGTEITYQYRSDNLVTQMTRPDGVTFTLSYDAAKRMVQRQIGSQDTYNYSYDARDQLITVENNTGTVTFTYDDFGRIVSETVNGETTTYQYNNEDETTSLTSLGITQNQQYDSRGLLTQLSANGATYIYGYDANTRLSSIDRNNVSDSGFQYDVADQLVQIDNGASLRGYQYQYDLASRISQWQGVADENRTFEYDDTGRLTNVSSPSDPESYSYDTMGNRLNDGAQIDAANRITENADYLFSYDVNGNRIEKTDKNTGSVERYSYNALDQLIGYQQFANADPQTAASVDYNYSYGPLGRRWSKTNNLSGEAVAFYWSGTSMVGEAFGANYRRYVLEGYNPIGFISNNENYYYLKDHIGTAHEVVNDSNTTVWRANISSFGNASEAVSIVENNLRFAGQYLDREMEMHYNLNRNYDPRLGRYIQSDSIGLQGGLNTYLYAGANPLMFIDPLGLCPCGSPQDAIDNARNDNRDWSRSADRTDVNSGFGSGTYKCNLFTDTSFESAGFNLPNVGGSWLSSLLGRYPPGAQSLSDPNYDVAGWPVVSGPSQPGDLVAEDGHVGISTGNGNTISATPSGVVENDWGSRPGQSPVVRRCSCN